MTNKEIAEMLRHVAAAYILKDENKYRFQIIAYQKAADSIEHEVRDLKDLWQDQKLSQVAGIGKTITGYLEELFTENRVKHFAVLFKEIPKPVFALMKVPGMGPKRASKLVKILKLEHSKDPVTDLKNCALKDKIASIEGFGEKSQKEIIKNIESFQKGQTKQNRMVLPRAYDIAKDVISYLKDLPEVKIIETLGSLRRMSSTVGDIDIAIASDSPAKVLDYFIKYPQTGRVLEKGDYTSSIVTKTGAQIDLMIQPQIGFGALLQHFTGSKSHNIRLRELAIKQGLSLSEYGIKPKDKVNSEKLKVKSYNSKLKIFQFDKEEDFYYALGLPWIPPELREDRGEIDAALNNKLPKLVELKDIKGDLHIHSNFDIEPSHDLGINSMEEVSQKAVDLGYSYIAFSEHSPSIKKHNQQQISDILKRKKEKIDKLNYSWKQNSEKRVLKIFNSLEIDILTDGNLSVKKGLNQLDFAIASVHSSFGQTKEEMTKRILNGLSDPKIKILGHPTGRLFGNREGYDLDWDKLFDFCLKNQKALEINAYPTRLDLPDTLVFQAKKYGVKMVINTDSHSLDQMDLMFYGVSVARRGWLEKDDIINCLTYSEFNNWISS